MRPFAMAATFAVSLGSLVSAAQAFSDEQSPGFAPRATNGSCTFSKTAFSASTLPQDTTSTSFVNLGDGGSILFKQVDTGCVAGTFFGNAGNTSSGDNVRLLITLDGNACAPLTTGTYVFANSDTDFSSHAVAFFCGATVAAGLHKVQVQWSTSGAGVAEIFEHTLEVDHR
jgi:hypothetical protein